MLIINYILYIIYYVKDYVLPDRLRLLRLKHSLPLPSKIRNLIVGWAELCNVIASIGIGLYRHCAHLINNIVSWSDYVVIHIADGSLLLSLHHFGLLHSPSRRFYYNPEVGISRSSRIVIAKIRTFHETSKLIGIVYSVEFCLIMPDFYELLCVKTMKDCNEYTEVL